MSIKCIVANFCDQKTLNMSETVKDKKTYIQNMNNIEVVAFKKKLKS